MRMQIGRQTKGSPTIIASLVMFLFSWQAYSAEGHLSVGNPNDNGSVEVYVHFPGVYPAGADSNGNLLVKVTKIKKGEGAEAKAGKIAAAINAKFNGTTVATAAQTAGGGWQVNLSYDKNGTPIAGNAWIPLRGDHTGEGDSLAYVDSLPSGSNSALTGMIGFDTGLSGVDQFGNVSTFTGELGYDGLSDIITLTFTQLTEPTLDGLTFDMYNGLLAGLPSDLQPDLHLDLADDEISFNFPLGQTSYFAGALSTDSLVEVSGGLATTTPEPTSLLLFGSGLLGLSGALRRHLRSGGRGASSSQTI